ncbi:MAG: GTPase ObgE [Persicimonas sp.]
MFVDEAKINIEAGRGGDGVTAFRREKFVARGGPNGGDGGKGGDVVFVGTTNQHTLSTYRHQKHIRAENGEPGGSNNCTGADGEDRVLEVPVGTLVYDDDTGELIVDLVEEGQRVVVAEGGKGGLGNTRFKSSTNRAPRKSTPGKPGEERTLRLELKLIADVGLVGYPSVGKSTIISTVSSAKPKVAAYQFTTLTPNLGVVNWTPMDEFTIADIPGLIEGAHEGKGLGIQFLKHIERTNLIVHVLEVLPEAQAEAMDRDPIKDFETLRRELESYNPKLLDLPEMVCLNKVDLTHVAAKKDELRAYFEEEHGLPFIAISAATGEGLDEFKKMLGRAVKEDTFETDVKEWWEE